MLPHLVNGLSSLGNLPDIGWLFLGATVGVLFGVMPGLGGAVVLSIILIFAYDIPLVPTLCLFLGVQAGSYYAASISSILLNTPAHPEAFAVTLDGFPMARRGQAGRALGLSAASTCLGGLVGCVLLTASIPIFNLMPGIFHPPEFLALVTIAMLLVGTLGAGSVGKALVAAGLGLMTASVGTSITTGVFRYGFGQTDLLDGVSLVGVALGALAIPQMAMMFGTGTAVAQESLIGRKADSGEAVKLDSSANRQLIGGLFESFRHWPTLLQAGTTGAIVGAIPGIGGFAANFLSYGIRRQISRNRDRFGTGTPEGVIAAEGSSLAKEAGQMVPIISLGIPGGVGGALFMGALAIKDVKVGYGFTSAYPTVPYQIVWIMAITGIIGTAIGVILGPQLAKVTKLPGPIIVPFVVAMSVIGPYITETDYLAVIQVFIFAVIGLVLIRLRYPIATFVLGLVLGPTFETNAFLTHSIYPGLSFIEKRPLADVLFLIALGILALKFFETRHENRRAREEAEKELSGVTDPAEREDALRSIELKRKPYPLLSLIATACLLVLSAVFLAYGLTHYDFTTELMPGVAGLAVAVPCFFTLPFDVRRYVMFRRHKRRAAELNLALADQVPPDDDSGEPSIAGIMRSVVPATPPAAPSPTGAYGTEEHAGETEPDESFTALVTSIVLTPSQHVPRQAQSPLVIEQESAVAVAEASRPAAKEFKPIETNRWGRHGQYTRELVFFVWLVALMGASYVFGYIWAVPVFIGAYGLACTRRFFKTRQAWIAFSVIATVVMWAVTRELFNITSEVFSPLINL